MLMIGSALCAESNRLAEGIIRLINQLLAVITRSLDQEIEY